MDWHRGGSRISDEAWGAVDENGASGVLESKVSVPAELWVQIGRTWGELWLSESSEKRFMQIRSGLVRLWVVDGIEKKSLCSRKTTWQDI